MLFQSTPAFSGEGTSHVSQLLGTGPVSIHPRLFRRGNVVISQCIAPFCPFQSTPAFSGEGTVSHLPSCCPVLSFNPPPPFQARELVPNPPLIKIRGFQSTPAFSGEGTLSKAASISSRAVSIHPRLFRRGNGWGWLCITGDRGFNPPPPFQARELPCGKPMIIGKLSER